MYSYWQPSLFLIRWYNYYSFSLSIEWKERVNVLLKPNFLLVILNICSQNKASVVCIAKFGGNSGLKNLPIIITLNLGAKLPVYNT